MAKGREFSRTIAVRMTARQDHGHVSSSSLEQWSRAGASTRRFFVLSSASWILGGPVFVGRLQRELAPSFKFQIGSRRCHDGPA
eukprot:7539073-Pyramimonas_sp.AAC.1